MPNPSSHGFRDGRFVLQDRDVAYAGTREGQRFMTTHQTPGTVIAGSTSFVATAPTFMLFQADADTNIVLESIELFLDDDTTPTVPIIIAIAIDNVDRFVSGGTAILGQNANADSSEAADATFQTTESSPIVASAAGAGTRFLKTFELEATAGRGINFTPRGGIQIPRTGSILVYTFSDVAPSWTFGFEWVQEQ